MNYSLFTPDYSHLTGLLKHLNDDELRELLNNEDKSKALVSDLKQVHDIEAEREMLLTSNKSLSEYNLSKKPILEEHRKQVEETRKIAIDLKDSLMAKKKKIESHQQAASSDTLLALLQAATSEKEEEAEASVEQFLQNEIPVEDFITKYLEIRKVAHLRRIKADKLANMLTNQNGRVSSAAMPPTRPERINRKAPAPPTVSPPYPSGNAWGNYPTSTGTPYAPARPAPQPPRGAYTPPYPSYPAGYPNMPSTGPPRPVMQPGYYNTGSAVGYPQSNYPKYK